MHGEYKLKENKYMGKSNNLVLEVIIITEGGRGIKNS
jgi:hypothetical protein